MSVSVCVFVYLCLSVCVSVGRSVCPCERLCVGGRERGVYLSVSVYAWVFLNLSVYACVYTYVCAKAYANRCTQFVRA